MFVHSVDKLAEMRTKFHVHGASLCIECIHLDVYDVADVVQLILCCSALNSAAAETDSRVTHG